MSSSATAAIVGAWQRIEPALDPSVAADDAAWREHCGPGRDPPEALCEYFARGHELVLLLEQALQACGAPLAAARRVLVAGDQCARSARFLRCRLPAERVAVGALDDERLGAERFDVVLADSPLERAPERAFGPILERLYACLVRGGVLMIATRGLDGEAAPQFRSTGGDARFTPAWFLERASALPELTCARLAARAHLGEFDLWVLGRGRPGGSAPLALARPPRIEIDRACLGGGGRAEVSGWALDHGLAPVAELLVLGRGLDALPERAERADVAAALGSPAAAGSGFSAGAALAGPEWPRHAVVLARDAGGRATVRARAFAGAIVRRAPTAVEAKVLEKMQRGRRVLAYGGLFGVYEGELHPGGLYPHLAERAAGSRLWDASGREYVDWFLGWGPMLLGHRHPAVEAAIERQLRVAPALSLMHDLEIDVAERLAALIPCAEQVAFGKNGSDATLAAVRVARAATGREVVAACGYHGFHDWSMAQYPWCAGVPAALKELLRTFPYNDLPALAVLLKREPVAAVILEPTANALPRPGFLEGVQGLARRHGAVLIFDEMVTGFRVARGGAQEAFGVVPDLACFGKALANGMPLSALVGRRELMAHLPRVGFGLTYRGELLSLAAAQACLEIHAREPIAERVMAAGETLRARFAALAARHGLVMALQGFAARMTTVADAHNGISGHGIRTLFVQQALREGVLTNGTFMPCAALDEVAIEHTCAALDRALAATARAVATGVLAPFLDVPPTPACYAE